MALTRIGAELDYLIPGGGGGGEGDGNQTVNVISRTISKKYSSEVEVLSSTGELDDVIYSGAETTTSETSIGDTIGTLLASGSDVTIRSRVEFSNEDVAKATTEKITFDF